MHLILFEEPNFVRTRKLIPTLSNESGLDLKMLLLMNALYYLPQDDAKIVAQYFLFKKKLFKNLI